MIQLQRDLHWLILTKLDYSKVSKCLRKRKLILLVGRWIFITGSTYSRQQQHVSDSDSKGSEKPAITIINVNISKLRSSRMHGRTVLHAQIIVNLRVSFTDSAMAIAQHLFIWIIKHEFLNWWKYRSIHILRFY